LYWIPRDKWHRITALRIREAIDEFYHTTNIHPQDLVVNLGSGGMDHGIPARRHIHLDIAIGRLCHVKHAIGASINEIPFKKCSASLLLCVGGVLNYADPCKAIPEMAATLQKGGHLILEFESSRSLDFSFAEVFGQPSAMVETFYNGQRERIRVYSEDFIVGLLKRSGISVVRSKRFHILSPLFYRLFGNADSASRWASLDYLAQLVPGLRKIGSNVILLGKK
jgi:hypothetical protein